MTIKQSIIIIFLSLVYMLSTLNTQNTYAQSNDPLEITTDGYLEWQRANKKFIAKRNAKAIQGATSIQAETLEAKYTEGKDGKGMEIQTLNASGAVIITSKSNSAFGDKATYDVSKDYAEMTGNALKMVAPDQTLTARDRFEYWITQGRLIATGNAKLVRPKPNGTGSDTLEANELIATLQENVNGKRRLKTLEAKQNVIITTPTEKITGTYGKYTAQTNTAEITGTVKITRGPNILEGTRATVDLNTNISRMYGSQTNTNNGRVRGVFYPNSEKEKSSAPQKPQQEPLPAREPTPLAPTNIRERIQLTPPKPKPDDKPSVEILLPSDNNTP